MGNFYIETVQDDKVIYELSATTSVGITVPSTLTNYPLEDGKEVTDNIVVKNKKVDLQGVLTDVSARTGIPLVSTLVSLLTKNDSDANEINDVEDYIKDLVARIDRKETFNVHFSESLPPLTECVITNFRYLKTNEMGGEAWQVSLSLQQIRFANRAEIVKEPSADWKPLIESAKEEAKTSKGVTPESKAQRAEKGFFETIQG